MTFEEAKAYMQKIGLKPKTEKEGLEMFQQWWDDNQEMCEEIGLPRHPEVVYSVDKQIELNEKYVEYYNEMVNCDEKTLSFNEWKKFN